MRQSRIYNQSPSAIDKQDREKIVKKRQERKGKGENEERERTAPYSFPKALKWRLNTILGLADKSKYKNNWLKKLKINIIFCNFAKIQNDRPSLSRAVFAFFYTLNFLQIFLQQKKDALPLDIFSSKIGDSVWIYTAHSLFFFKNKSKGYRDLSTLSKIDLLFSTLLTIEILKYSIGNELRVMTALYQIKKTNSNIFVKNKRHSRKLCLLFNNTEDILFED